MRPHVTIKDNLEDRLLVELTNRSFIVDESDRLLLPPGFCVYSNLINNIKSGAWVLYLKVNNNIYAVLVARYNTYYNGFNISFLCRNNNFKPSKGSGGVLLKKFIRAVKKITNNNPIIYLTDTINDNGEYYTNQGFSPRTGPDHRREFVISNSGGYKRTNKRIKNKKNKKFHNKRYTKKR